MSKNTIIILLVGALLFALFTCAGIGAYAYITRSTATPDPSQSETQLAQMINAALTQTFQAQVPSMAPIIMSTATLPPTWTPMPPPVIPSATLPPPVILFSPTPVVPQIWVSVDTNCRVGPGKVYDRVGYLLVGQVSEVYGRNPAGDYWYIRNLNNNTAYCWLWGEYATVTGNIGALPIFTPPPSPTPVPNFDASYAGKDYCSTWGWWVDLKLQNTGGVAFRSMTLTVKDTVTGTSQTMYADNFTDYNGCSESYSKPSLDPGTNRIVSSPNFSYDPTGHLLRATISLCSNTGQSGTCLTEVIEFTP